VSRSDGGVLGAEPGDGQAPAGVLRHVPALDGLRGLAVLAVLVYHLSPDGLSGGFLGVSLFFTLSGFLITNLLLTEWRTSRTIDLRRFWARRFRRLLPAAVAGIALALVVAWLAADADQLAQLRGDVVSSLGYATNWRFILNGDAYGAGYQEPSPLLHYWSLAIEEQFYILVALVALLLARVTHRRRAWFVVFGGLTVLSMLATVLLAGAPDARIYFGSDTRAFELLAGVLLALGMGFVVPERLRRWQGRHVVALAVLCLVLFSYVAAATTQAWLYRGGLWLVALGSVGLIVAAIDGGPVSRALSWRPLTALGLVSYGVYVYHWPLFVWLDTETTGLDGPALALLRVLITLALAVASYRWLERPVRSGRLTWRPLAAGGAIAVTVTALVIGTVALDRQAVARAVVDDTPELRLGMPAAATAPLESAATPPPSQAPEPTPALQRVLFVGDSLVHQAWPTIEDRLRQAGVEARVSGGEGEHLLSGPDKWLGQLTSELDAFDPDLVVLESCCGWGMPRRRESHLAPDGSVLQPDSDASWNEWTRVALVLTESVRRQGRAAMWLLAPPAQTNGYYGPIEARIERVNAIYQRIAQCHPGVGLLDWRVIAAPDGSFAWELPDAQGHLVPVRHSDGLHFTREGQAVLADFTRDQLQRWWLRLGGRQPPVAATCPV
jgi:peptidoglycan/LPS O-acetylase OafA/YrhL